MFIVDATLAVRVLSLRSRLTDPRGIDDEPRAALSRNPILDRRKQWEQRIQSGGDLGKTVKV